MKIGRILSLKKRIQGGDYRLNDTVKEMSTWSCFNGDQEIVEDEKVIDSHSHESEHHHNGCCGSVKPVVREDLKVGRNEPCPCGSGKKFKMCHGSL